MFVPAANTAQGNLSRPFILGVLLLLLLLSTQSEWAASQRRHNQNLIQVGQDIGETQRKRQVKDDILLELSVLNENLEKENKRLKTIALELDRALRLCGMGEKSAQIIKELDNTLSPSLSSYLNSTAPQQNTTTINPILQENQTNQTQIEQQLQPEAVSGEQQRADDKQQENQRLKMLQSRKMLRG
eukprot:TRINITY_DN2752_c0_g1_i1.p3 TRINITY_DN2752_c0_g1~~TRINITY_DN2752_c0_g1_i1.p3  ORF type:complete len:186 (-),score=21.97 TRINITY_DN2752_c0_g1_i1:409-966(-)